MALTSCPECGGKISTSVDQCVHCGCKITVCPVCGKVYINYPNFCGECGHNFDSNQIVLEPYTTYNAVSQNDTVQMNLPNTPSNNSEILHEYQMPNQKKPPHSQNIPSITKVINDWRGDTSLGGYYALQVFGILSVIHGIPPMVIGLIMLLRWAFAEFSQSIPILAPFLLISGYFLLELDSIFSRGAEAVVINKLWSWSKSKNIDLCPIIENSLFEKVESMKSSDEKDYRKRMEFAISAQCYNTLKMSKGKEVWMQILSTIFSTISYSLLAIFCIINSDIIFESIFKFDLYTNWEIFIAAAVIWAINLFLFANANKKAKEATDTWMRKTFSAGAYARYSAHIKN